MLNFEKTLLIGSLLDLFVANVGGREGGGLVRLRKGVENPNIDEGALEPPSPHSICRHVQASLIRPDGRAETKLLSCEGFQVRLHRDIGGNPLQQTSCDVTNFVVADAGVASSRTRQGMRHSELAATGARGGQTLQVPVVPEVQSIAEFCLGEGEAVALQGAACQPAGCPLLRGEIDDAPFLRGQGRMED